MRGNRRNRQAPRPGPPPRGNGGAARDGRGHDPAGRRVGAPGPERGRGPRGGARRRAGSGASCRRALGRASGLSPLTPLERRARRRGTGAVCVAGSPPRWPAALSPRPVPRLRPGTQRPYAQRRPAPNSAQARGTPPPPLLAVPGRRRGMDASCPTKPCPLGARRTDSWPVFGLLSVPTPEQRGLSWGGVARIGSAMEK